MKITVHIMGDEKSQRIGGPLNRACGSTMGITEVFFSAL
jgi:hypothetical protein